jgi:hypothetical protein
MTEYLPVDQDLRQDCQSRKQDEYNNLVKHYFSRLPQVEDTVSELSSYTSQMSSYEAKNFKQIKIDVYRTQPEVKLFATQIVQTMLIRLLFVWSMRNPASAYVQGINDLAAPILMVFLQGFMGQSEFSEQQLTSLLSS